MEKEFILPMYPDSKDIPLPTLSYKIRVYDEYSKSLFNFLSANQYFLFCPTTKDFVFSEGLGEDTLSSVEPIAVVCKIDRIVKYKTSYRVEFTAEQVAFLSGARVLEESPIIVGTGNLVDNVQVDSFMLAPFIKEIKNRYEALTKKLKGLPKFPSDEEINKYEPSYYLAFFLNLSHDDKLTLLRNRDPQGRLKFVSTKVNTLNSDPEIENRINAKVEKAIENNQKEFILREKMKALKDELKEFDGPTDEDLYNKVLEDKDGNYPESVKAKVKSEMTRLKTMPGASQEAAVIKTYLDILIKLPWVAHTDDNSDMVKVKKVLDDDHYGLVKQKERILEYLAVKELTHSLKSPILCLYGPPGTGKTSLAISIAKALNRKFVKIALGGISDESEIRGHRRTYVGAMPGKIIANLNRVGVNNPVMLLDEIDKLRDGGYHGDPASALLEVLDPEQNVRFQDNYLEETFDLSNVLFICTANNIKDIPAPLRDRLELIELNTYTKYEKYHIAFEHLIPLELEANGLKKENISFTPESMFYLIENYTMEAGVRELRRKIGSIMRKFAVSFLTKGEKRDDAHIEVTKEIIEEYLGKPIYNHTKNLSKDQVGVVNGLAYTDFGGEILPIEITNYKGTGQVLITGNLGKVMEESARAAFSYVKSVAPQCGVNMDFFKENDFHIHAPEGAVPKDGPSAGVALSLLILSCCTNLPLRSDVGMTGEVDLRGNSMPIGGLREKSLAALREGLKTILVPKDNHKDVEELPQEVKDGLNIIEVENVKEACNYAFVTNPFLSKNIKVKDESSECEVC